METDMEKLLIEIYGTVQRIEADLKNIKKEQENRAIEMGKFETRISRLEKIVYAGITVIAVFEPILIEIVKHYIEKKL